MKSVSSVPLRDTISIGGAFTKWVYPIVGDTPLIQIDNLTLKPLIEKMSASLRARTVNKYVEYVKQLVKSLKAPNGEPIFKRTWDAETMDLPVVEYSEQKRPSLKVSTVSALITGSSRTKCAVRRHQEQPFAAVLTANTSQDTGFCSTSPWAWLLDRGWLPEVHSGWLGAFVGYSIILWIPAALYLTRVYAPHVVPSSRCSPWSPKLPNPKSIISVLCFYVLFTLGAVSAKADTTYTYTGKPFTAGICFTRVVVCLGASVDGSLTLASPLGDNLHGVVVKPESFSFEADGLIVNNLNVSTPSTFAFSTNSTGQIIGWNISVTGNADFNGVPVTVTIGSFSNLAFINGENAEDNISSASPDLGGPGNIENLNMPGTWAVSSGHAETISGASAIADCNGFSLSVSVMNLSVGSSYTIDFTFTLTPTSGAPITVPGTINFVATGATATKTASGTWPSGPLTANFTVTGSAVLTASGSMATIKFNGATSLNLTCGGTGCPATLGFWKNTNEHPFPDSVQTSGLKIGGVTYSAPDLLTILNKNGGNAVAILGRQLVAALLNLAAGAKHNVNADAAIATAEALLKANNLNLLTSDVHPSTALGKALLAPEGVLDSYNNANFHSCPEGSDLTTGN